jgi:hypothetical protein
MLPAALAAAEPAPWSALPARWQRALGEIDGRLRAGEPERARRAAESLERDLARRPDLDLSGSRALALACALRAVAEAGLGLGDEALWTWRTAAALDPEAVRFDPGAYGEPARRLAETPFRHGHADAGAEGSPAHAPPQPQRRPRPRYPRGFAFLGVDVEYAVQVVVGADGRPREPLIVRRPSYAGLVWALLESLRKWEFTPAHRDGEPVAAVVTVSTGFDLP